MSVGIPAGFNTPMRVLHGCECAHTVCAGIGKQLPVLENVPFDEPAPIDTQHTQQDAQAENDIGVPIEAGGLQLPGTEGQGVPEGTEPALQELVQAGEPLMADVDQGSWDINMAPAEYVYDHHALPLSPQLAAPADAAQAAGTLAGAAQDADVSSVFSGEAFAAAAADAAQFAAVRAAAWLPRPGQPAPAVASTAAPAGSAGPSDERRLWMLNTLSDTLLHFSAIAPAQSGSAAEVIRSASARIAALQTQVTSRTLHTGTATALDFCVRALTRALTGDAPAQDAHVPNTVQEILGVLCEEQ